MKRHTALLIGLSAALMLAGCSSPYQGSSKAATTTPDGLDAQAVKAASDLVVQQSKGNSHVAQVFAGPGGLIGLLLTVGQPPNEYSDMMYATPDGGYLLYNTVAADHAGNNPAAGYADKFNAHKLLTMRLNNYDGSAPLSEEKAKTLDSLVVATEGHGPRVIYVMTDPMCPYCRRAFSDLKNTPALYEQLTVKVIMAMPVGGDYSAMITDRVIKKELTVDQAMDQPHPKDGMQYPMTEQVTKYRAATDELFDDVVRTHAVPAVIASKDGQWVARTGFSPNDYLPNGAF